MAAILLAGCPVPPAPTGGPAGKAVPGKETGGAAATSAPHLGRPYDVVASDSLLTILVYRAGALAKAGHNHVIASHDLSGTIYVPADVMRTSFEIHLPVGGLTVDEASLRAKEGGDFSAEVPDSAKEGTRRNMLGEALLNAEQSAEIILRSERLEAGTDGQLQAHVQAEVRQTPHSLVVPVRYEMSATEVVVSGELPLKQTDLGLTPFSALLGALQVQDEMLVKFRIVARPAPTSTGAGH